MQFRRVRAPLATLAAALTLACAPLGGLSICFGENGHLAIELPAAAHENARSCEAAQADACGCVDACGPCRDARGPSDPGVRLERPIDPAAFAWDVAVPLPVAIRTHDPSHTSAGARVPLLRSEHREPHPQRAAILLI